MLKKIHIEQFVLIDHLDLDIQSGLTVLTGETGAGKSIFLDALGLMLGEPPDTGAIRYGCDQSVVEAVFAPPAYSSVWELLIAKELVEKGQSEFSVRRVIRMDGNDTIEVNGKSVALDVLKQIGLLLCEIHGQNANYQLLSPAYQLNLLDMSGKIPPEVFKNVADAFHDVNKYKEEERQEVAFYNSHIKKLSDYESIVRRLEEAGLEERTFEEINAEYMRLLIAYETCETLQDINSRLIASNGVIMALSGANAAFAKNKNLEQDKVKALGDALSTALESARFAANEARMLGPEYEIDTKPLRDYKNRVTVMREVAAEANCDVANLGAYYEDLKDKVSRLQNGLKRMEDAKDRVRVAEVSYVEHAHELTRCRIAAGEELSKAINVGLPLLKLNNAEFKVDVEEQKGGEWTERGFNFVTFMARMNTGQEFSSIAETASGGELARLVLALKIVIQTIQAIPTLVFDEVDVGIGGAAAAAVGERIAYLADTTQVIVITHSPQVASRGEQQLHVSKKSSDGTTTSSIRVMSHEERVSEISRMLAGDTITFEAQAAANKLLEEAVSAAVERKAVLRSKAELFAAG